MIPCASPQASYRARQAEINAAVQRVLDKGRYILGDEVQAFENEFAGYVGASHGIGVASGTDALHIALRACEIGPGDEVITASHTAVATVAAIELAGATPVLVDIEPEFYTIDPQQIEQRITRRTKAIVPVHIYGQPADLGPILRIARTHGLRVIEDCAQAHGAEVDLETLDHGPPISGSAPTTDGSTLQSEINGSRSKVRGPAARVGSLGDIGCFSFYPTKNLGALGDGGGIVTSDAALAARCRLLREYGWAQRYVSHIAGLNSRLDELQAAVLLVKLRHLDDDNAKRVRIAAQYAAGLAETRLGLPVVRGQGAVISDQSSRASTDYRSPITDHSHLPIDHRPRTMGPFNHVYNLYVVRSRKRDELRTHLVARGIGALIHYPVPVHLQPAYRGRLPGAENLPETERAARQVLSLPMYPELSPNEVQAVVNAIRSA